MKTKFSHLLKIRGGISLRFVWTFAALASIAALGASIVLDDSQTREEAQLAQDVRALNKALEVHRIFRGDIVSSESVNGILAQLQRFDGNETLIDHRLCAEEQDSQEAATGAPRAFWNRITKRFEIAHGAVRGVKRFYIDENSDLSRLAEEHRIAKLDFEAKDSWIWSHEGEATPVVKSIQQHGSKSAQ